MCIMYVYLSDIDRYPFDNAVMIMTYKTINTPVQCYKYMPYVIRDVGMSGTRQNPNEWNNLDFTRSQDCWRLGQS